jgi:hypothetical protein
MTVENTGKKLYKLQSCKSPFETPYIASEVKRYYSGRTGNTTKTEVRLVGLQIKF